MLWSRVRTCAWSQFKYKLHFLRDQVLDDPTMSGEHIDVQVYREGATRDVMTSVVAQVSSMRDATPRLSGFHVDFVDEAGTGDGPGTCLGVCSERPNQDEGVLLCT